MAKEKKETPMLNFDGVEYNIDEMTDEQKAMLNHISDLDRKVGSAEFNLTQLKFGREAFISSLRDSLKVEEVVETKGA